MNTTPTRGMTIDDTDPQALREAIDMAFDYRGDVTLTVRGNPDALEGYVYDRRATDDMSASVLRFLPTAGGERLTVAYADVTSLTFSGRDTAAGKSWDTWVRKYIEKKMAGEKAEIESEQL